VWIVLTGLPVLRKQRSLAALGMTVAHLGVAMFIVGVTLTSIYSIEKDVRLAPGQSINLGGYDFRFEGVTETQGPNYVSDTGTVIASRDGKFVAELLAEKRIYRVQQMPMTEAGIDAGLTRDLFVALGEPLGKEGAWSLRLYHKPFIRWIWVGCLVMGLGGVLAAADRRYRLLARRAHKTVGTTEEARA
jgi:cytochrome c-type biogenesis protein CcmF